MIEIKCNKLQKKVIIAALLDPDGCLFPQKRRWCILDKDADCKKCFENNIKWDIH